LQAKQSGNLLIQRGFDFEARDYGRIMVSGAGFRGLG
jgi:hypothetical protein